MTIHIQAEVDTDLAPETIRAAVLDFTDRRLEIWEKTLDPKTYEVHWVDETSAEVTEGSARPFVWSRERYDWSDPTLVTWTTQASNFCVPGSHIAMDVVPRGDGGTRLSVTWERTPSNLKGRLYLGIAALGGRRLLTWATKQALGNIRAAPG